MDHDTSLPRFCLFILWILSRLWFSTSVTSENRGACAAGLSLALVLQLYDSCWDFDFLSFNGMLL